jgi:hypothetical protein
MAEEKHFPRDEMKSRSSAGDSAVGLVARASGSIAEQPHTHCLHTPIIEGSKLLVLPVSWMPTNRCQEISLSLVAIHPEMVESGPRGRSALTSPAWKPQDTRSQSAIGRGVGSS